MIVGDATDPHVQAVLNAVYDLGGDPRVFDREAGSNGKPATLAAEWRPDRHECLLTLLGTDLHQNEIDAVWWWEKRTPVNVSQGGSIPVTFAYREWKRTLEGLSHLLPQARWMNPRPAAMRARSKVTQLEFAANAGLRVPPTLVTNDPDSVRKFVAAAPDGAIYKTLSWFFTPPNWTIFTTKIGPDEVAGPSADAALRLAPGIFQHLVPKAYEVRVTVVDGEMYPVAIDSQAHPDARVDWRRVQHKLNYETTELPQHVANGLRTLMDRLGIIYAAHDFIVTPDGEHIYLETNAAGQWLWLEHRTGSAISAAIASWLVLGRTGRAQP